MAGAIIQGLRSLVQRQKPVYDVEKEPKTGFANLPIKKKLESIVAEVTASESESSARKNMGHYISALYYSGVQNVQPNESGTGIDIFEKDDYHVENKFRPQVDAVVGMLNRLEPPFSCGPGSDSPEDIAASRTSDSAMTLMLDNIAYDSLKHLKNLYKALFGTSFQFTDYVVDGSKYGHIVEPQFDYPEEPMPVEEGEAGAEAMPPVMSKVVTGFKSRPKGSEIALVCSPIEVRTPSDTKGGLVNAPWLQWRSRHDVETLQYVYKGLKVSAGSDDDSASRHLEVLANVAGSVGSSVASVMGSAGTGKADLLRTWLTPCKFKGDAELEKEFPDGCHVATVNGQVVDYYPEKLADRWTAEVLIPLPHSLHGDGLVDALPIQDQKNLTNSLVIKHIDYSTVGHTIVRDGVIDSKEWVNDPEHGLIIARNIPMEMSIDQVVKQLMPAALSQDVGAWLQHEDSAMQMVTSAEDPVLGKSLGANTPYSQSVFLAEKAQARWAGSAQFNKPELKRFYRQLLDIAKNHWIDERSRSIKDNAGQWSFEKFTQANLQGSVDVILGDVDNKPRSRAEKVQALDALVQLWPLIQTFSPKQKAWIEEVLGMPADSNPMNAQVARAMRNIDRIKKGETVTPLPMVDDPVAQIPAYKEFLLGEKGEALAMENPEAFANVYAGMMALMQMQMAAMSNPMTMAAHGIAHGGPTPPEEPGAAGSAPKPNGTPGGQPGQKGGGPGSLSQPEAQSPAPAPPVAAPSPV